MSVSLMLSVATLQYFSGCDTVVNKLLPCEENIKCTVTAVYWDGKTAEESIDYVALGMFVVAI